MEMKLIGMQFMMVKHLPDSIKQEYKKPYFSLRSNSKGPITFDRNFLRNEIFPLLDSRWNNFAQRINSMSNIIQERNDNYTNLFLEKYGELVGHKIDINKLKSLQESLIIDVLRYSIKACNLAAPNSKIMKEIVKTFINSDPGPKSQVSWSRSDKEEPGGSITYKKGFLLISKK